MDEMKKVSSAEAGTSGQEKEDAKRKRILKYLWPATEIGGGFDKAYFATYANYLYTNVYMMGALYSGIIAMAQNILRWVGGPFFGTVIDRVSFKKGKYYPWIILGRAVAYIAWIILFSLPLFGISGVTLRPFALALVLLIAVSDSVTTAPIHGIFPQITKDTKERQFIAMIQKICRDGGKTVFGYVCPALLMFFMAKVDESKAYAVTGLIVGILSFVFYLALGLGLKGSYIERKAMENTHAASGKKKMSVIQTFRILFTNKALVMMYLFTALQKSYYFIYFFYATYMFNYMFEDFGLLGTFMLVFNLSAIIGAMFGPAVQKFLKDIKQMLIVCTGVHVVILLILALFMRQFDAVTFMAVFAVSSFFMGLIESFYMPMFAASSDYCTWKSRTRMDGLNMSIYSLAISTGMVVSSAISTAVLTKFGLDGVVASGVATETFLGGLGVLFGWIPLILGCAALVIFVFFPLNSKRIGQINEDLAAGKTAETSEYKF